MMFIEAESRGKAEFSWLKSRHTFSFSDYFDPQRMGFGALRVINDDIISPLGGFDTHPHKNMEIITIPLRGVLKHKDSTGHEENLGVNEVQMMSAGRGIWHSEFNASHSEDVQLLQIWIEPHRLDIHPRYEQKEFNFDLLKDQLKVFISPDNEILSLRSHPVRDEFSTTLRMNQNAYFSMLNLHEKYSYQAFDSSNGVFMMILSGEVLIEGKTLKEKDALGLTQDEIHLERSQNYAGESRVLIIEVPMK